MITTPEIAAGFVLTGALVATGTVLAVYELGRLMSRDEEQRTVEVTMGETPRFPHAA